MLMRADGRTVRTLRTISGPAPSDQVDVEVVGWSPSGRSVAYELTDASGTRRYAINIRTRRVGAVRPPREGVVSPDGRFIAFNHDSGIFVARRDGSAARRILGPPTPWNADRYKVSDWQRLP